MSDVLRAAPELLCPAGDREKLEMALQYGADAVYLGGKEYGLRAFAGNFDPPGMREAVTLSHARGVRVYVTVNTLPHEGQLARLPAYLEQLGDSGADGLIVADLGVMALAKRYAPGLALHVSTQFGVMNSGTARMLHDLGASRVVLAREMCLEEIAALRANTPRELELEVFVHGAMCVSISGRCLLSNYMTGRDGNGGACAQPCRWRYQLMEEKRPGQFFPVEEDSEGTYLFNSKDMCMIDHIPELLSIGLDSLKIEGRAKSAYYTGMVTNAYRHAIDAAVQGQSLDPVWRAELDKVSHRPYSEGFWYGKPEQYLGDARYIRDWQVKAVVTACAPDGSAVLSLRNKFRRGEALELIGPGLTPVSFVAEDLADGQGVPLEEARTPQMTLRLTLPCQAPALSILRKKTSD